MTDSGSLSGNNVSIKVTCGSGPVTGEQIAQITGRVSEALRSAPRRRARWEAMTPEERAEARKQAIARMPEAYRAWYLRTFGKSAVAADEGDGS